VKPAVLIVDDSLTVRMDLRETFQSAGFDTTVCPTVAAARAALAEGTFSLVVLDVILPDGDGIELLREIKSISQATAVSVLLLSTEAEVRDRVRGLKTGADDYIGKPYDASAVLSRARQLIGVAQNSGPASPELLLIDDSLTFREQFKSVLEAAGYRIATAANGDEGVHAAVALRPHAIIVDNVMPGSLDGPAVIRRLKQDAALRQTPCLLLTGSDAPGEEFRALEAGADAYLRKSTDLEVILARIGALLRGGIESPVEKMGFSSLLSLKRILTIDDSPTYLNELAAELRKDGYDVIAAPSGREGLELLDSQPVDCILLDLLMPEMSGKETCQRIKSRPEWRAIPLLILTSMEEMQAMVESINAGADDYIQKSSDFEVLKARVRAQLRRKQFEDEHRSIQQQLLKKEIEATQARAAQQVAEARAAMVELLERKNRELEAFSYSVSHDLRAPLRAINGFSRLLLKDFAGELSPKAQGYLTRVYTSAERMAQLIDALLELSSLGRSEMQRTPVDLSQLGHAIAADLAQSARERSVEFLIEEGLIAYADARLLRIVLANLLGNAWKFTSHTPLARIELSSLRSGDEQVFFVRDNGVGFNMAHAGQLFSPFQRLHPDSDFPGNGIGLATVNRIMERHGGRVWAESEIGHGATIFFTLPGSPKSDPEWNGALLQQQE
jgi:two-component system, NtrC family, sensor kinase